MLELTKRQRDAKTWIAGYIRRKKIAPSSAELARGLGVSATAADALMHQLVKRKHATRGPHRMHRSLVLVPDPKPRQAIQSEEGASA